MFWTIVLVFGCSMGPFRVSGKSNDALVKELFQRAFSEKSYTDDDEFLNEIMRNGLQEEHYKKRDLAPEVHMDAKGLITSKGYPFEEHKVVTDDGYILTLHRIPRSKSSITKGEPVYVQHGLLGSSCDWITNTVDKSLGFLLADAGFDVWLGNVRGNTYAKEHTILKSSSRDFWKFSWDEMAKYDLPAVINYVIGKTNVSKINYVGFSQGSLIGFTGFSSYPDLAKLIKGFYVMGPVYTLKYSDSPVKYVAPFFKAVKFLFMLNPFSSGEFLNSGTIMKFLAKYACSNSISGLICGNFLFLLCGTNEGNMNKSRFPIYFSHTPAGTSFQNVAHFAQMYNVGECRKYDHGKSENLKRYGQSTPPHYDVTKMSSDIPVVLFSGGKDLMADPGDVRKLVPLLSGLKKHVYVDDYQHLDFMWGDDAVNKVYNPLIKMLKDA